MRGHPRTIALCLVALTAGASSTACEPSPLIVSKRVASLTCETPAGTVKLEITYETHSRVLPPPTLEVSVEKLRAAMARPNSRANVRDFMTDQWRVETTSFASNAFFGSATKLACLGGCAVHQFSGVDMKSWVFVAAPAEDRTLYADVHFSDVDRLYGAAPRARLDFVGFGPYQGYVLQTPDDAAQMPVQCR